MSDVLCFVVEERYLREANDNPNVAAVITSSRFATKVRGDVGLGVAPDPQYTFYELHNRLVRERGMAPAMAFGVAASARIHESAIVAEQCFIGERVEIGPLLLKKTLKGFGADELVDKDLPILIVHGRYPRNE
jgi:UDP-3-O-[3-hydroxymyristoyl] glucosamine N-acyltransferase